MKLFLVSAFLFVSMDLGVSMKEKNEKAPQVQVYSRLPGNFGIKNTLICHTSGFHPPEISIKLLKNGAEMESKQTDLAFEENWHYHLTKHAVFTPEKGETYTCVVSHTTGTKTYNWEPDM
ncbi:beta-2-microglobulin [Oryzias melastigma]|uniref:Beta-2-microglobulin n=1 Tax=Oryzias melastigma TaxID=30732 RepID=A0A3B3CNJ3_ORYME|nr:beta-2-microglobulin [Oryzias melastigma]